MMKRKSSSPLESVFAGRMTLGVDSDGSDDVEGDYDDEESADRSSGAGDGGGAPKLPKRNCARLDAISEAPPVFFGFGGEWPGGPAVGGDLASRSAAPRDGGWIVPRQQPAFGPTGGGGGADPMEHAAHRGTGSAFGCPCAPATAPPMFGSDARGWSLVGGGGPAPAPPQLWSAPAVEPGCGVFLAPLAAPSPLAAGVGVGGASPHAHDFAPLESPGSPSPQPLRMADPAMW